MKIALYTANFGKYDQWLEPRYVDRSFDYYLFTDDKSIKSKAYQVTYCDRAKDPARMARYYKIVKGYEQLCSQGYNLIIWHDASIRQVKDIKGLIMQQKRDWMLMKHPQRTCIYDEFHACWDAYPPKDDRQTMLEQIQRYADEGYPTNNGLVATGLMFRRNNKYLLDICRDWWAEVERGSVRDQLSFDYVAWVNNFKYDTVPFFHTLTYYFQINRHIKK